MFLCRKAEVEELFTPFGNVKDVYLPLNHYTRCVALPCGLPSTCTAAKQQWKEHERLTLPHVQHLCISWFRPAAAMQSGLPQLKSALLKES